MKQSVENQLAELRSYKEERLEEITSITVKPGNTPLSLEDKKKREKAAKKIRKELHIDETGLFEMGRTALEANSTMTKNEMKKLLLERLKESTKSRLMRGIINEIEGELE